MRNQVYIALAVVLVMLAGVSAWLGLREREPVYQGKRLSVWLEILNREKFAGLPSDRAGQAIRHIGTNALPMLIERLHAQDTPLKQMMMTWAQKQKLIHFHFKWAVTRRQEAIFGYEALGPLANAQVPRLIGTLINDPSPDVRHATASALGCIGPAARLAAPALFCATKDTDQYVRNGALWAWAKFDRTLTLQFPFWSRDWTILFKMHSRMRPLRLGDMVQKPEQPSLRFCGRWPPTMLPVVRSRPSTPKSSPRRA